MTRKRSGGGGGKEEEREELLPSPLAAPRCGRGDTSESGRAGWGPPPRPLSPSRSALNDRSTARPLAKIAAKAREPSRATSSARRSLGAGDEDDEGFGVVEVVDDCAAQPSSSERVGGPTFREWKEEGISLVGVLFRTLRARSSRCEPRERKRNAKGEKRNCISDGTSFPINSALLFRHSKHRFFSRSFSRSFSLGRTAPSLNSPCTQPSHTVLALCKGLDPTEAPSRPQVAEIVSLRGRLMLRRRRKTIIAFSTSPSSSPLLKPRGESGLDIAGSRPTSPRAWEEIKATLGANDVKHISPQELVFARDRGGGLLSSLPQLFSSALPSSSSSSSSSSPSSYSNGALILDIRPPDEFKSGHIRGAINIPLYRYITGLSPRAVARRAVFAFFGVLNGTEANPLFAEEVSAVLEGRKRIVAYCNVGGSFGSDTNKKGTQSRSMSAAYELIRAGICGKDGKVKVDMLKGGFNEWLKSEREVVVPE